jgi:hypothetical protein
MLKAIFNWFNHKQPAPQALAPAVRPEDAPYKIEPPVVPVLVGVPEPVVVEQPTKPVKKPRTKKAVENTSEEAKPRRARKKSEA